MQCIAVFSKFKLPASRSDDRPSYRVRPEPPRAAVNPEDVPLVTLSDEDDDDQFVGIDEEDENAQISDDDDVGLGGGGDVAADGQPKSPAADKVLETSPEPMPKQAKRQAEEKTQPSPPPATSRKTTRLRRGERSNSNVSKQDRNSDGEPLKSNSAETKDVASSHDGPEKDTTADNCKNPSNRNKVRELKRPHEATTAKTHVRSTSAKGEKISKVVDDTPPKNSRIDTKTTTKRSVGRPRKSPIVEDGSTSNAKGTRIDIKAMAKRPVGRPRKSPRAEDESINNAGNGRAKDSRADIPSISKRPVGRPLKSPRAEDGRNGGGNTKSTLAGPAKKESAEILSGKRRRRPPPRWKGDEPAEDESDEVAPVVTRSRSKRRKS